MPLNADIELPDINFSVDDSRETISLFGKTFSFGFFQMVFAPKDIYYKMHIEDDGLTVFTEMTYEDIIRENIIPGH